MPTLHHKPFRETNRKEWDKQRPQRKSYPHFYNTKRWKNLRLRILNQTPYCQQCWRDKNQYVYANVVDHIIDHRGNERLMWDEANLQSMCKPCHDHKNGLTLAQKRRNKTKPKERLIL